MIPPLGDLRYCYGLAFGVREVSKAIGGNRKFMEIGDIVVDKRGFVFYIGYRVVEMGRAGF